MMRRFPAAAIALLSMALSACGAREVALSAYGQGAATPQISGVPVPVATQADEADVARAIDQVRGAARPDPKDAAEDDAVDYGKMGPADFNTMPLKVTLSADCATTGQAMQATAVTLAGSKLAFVAAYSDNDFVPNFTYVPGEGNPTGTFTWTWEITPTTPRGDAMVNVVSSKGKKGASFKAPFRVADSC